jgi:hypothetical protein
MFEIRLEDECIYVGDEKSCRYIANMLYDYYKNDKPLPSIIIINQNDILSEKNDFGTQQEYIETCLNSNYELEYIFDNNIINKSICIIATLNYSIDGRYKENIFINCKLDGTLLNIEWIIDNLEKDEDILSYYIINNHNQRLNLYDIFPDIYKCNYKKMKEVKV